MKTHLILPFIICLTGTISSAHAQQLKSNATKLTEESYNWQQYDSLGDASIERNDTAQAILYYQKSVDANPQHRQENKTRSKLEKYYKNYGSSFYLKEY